MNRLRPYQFVILALLATPALGGVAIAAASEVDLEQSRHALIDEVSRDLTGILSAAGLATPNPRVLESMRRVPRHVFVPPPLAPYAYLNRPLPVGHGQTVSQPSIVALMTDLAGIRPDFTMLQIGIGGGYQAALLAELAGKVFCVELFKPVAEAAMTRLIGQGYDNVEVQVGDGYYGWREAGPFDAIIVRQAVHHIPPPLIAQLKPGGRLIMPVGPPDGMQHLVLVRKMSDGKLTERRILPVRFTTLPGGSRI